MEERKSAEHEGTRTDGNGTSKPLSFTAVHNKVKHHIDFEADKTIGDLKKYLERIVEVPASMQKVMVKGLAKDEHTLAEANVTQGCKIMVIGSKVADLLSVAAPVDKETLKEETAATATPTEKLSLQKIHRKILDKGLPEDIQPGFKGVHEPLPHTPLKGMVNKHNNKVRLTFKLEDDQVWIGTKERTDKLPMSSIKSIVSEAIEGHEEYHIVGIQLGPTEASRYWLYWVPAQYVDAIKETVLGKW